MRLEYQLLNGSNVKAYNDYHEANGEATKQRLLLAEYGDVYGSDMAYAYWNKSGNRDDDEAIIAYYKFNEQGKPVKLSEEELRHHLFN